MSELPYLAELLATHLDSQDDIDTLRNGIDLLHHSRRSLTPDNLSQILEPDIEPEVCENILYALQNQDIVESDDLDAEALQMVTECAKVLLSRESSPANKIVATIPESETEIDESDFGSLLLELREVIDTAEDELFVMNPFFSEQVVDKLRGPLENAASRGVSITVVTRYLTYNEDNSYNENFLANLLSSESVRDRTSVYEYVEDVEKLGGTFHAKLVIADQSVCYLGTANLTHRGLRDNLELGMILHDENVNKLHRMVSSLLNSSLIHRVVYDDGSFVRPTYS